MESHFRHLRTYTNFSPNEDNIYMCYCNSSWSIDFYLSFFNKNSCIVIVLYLVDFEASDGIVEEKETFNITAIGCF